MHKKCGGSVAITRLYVVDEIPGKLVDHAVCEKALLGVISISVEQKRCVIDGYHWML